MGPAISTVKKERGIKRTSPSDGAAQGSQREFPRKVSARVSCTGERTARCPASHPYAAGTDFASCCATTLDGRARAGGEGGSPS